VKHRHLIASRAAALLAAVPLIGACSPSRAAAGPPSPPALPSVRQGSDADLDAQLEAARKRLDEAAHEVARLSTQMSGAIVDQVMPYVGPGRAIIGVQLEPAAAGAGARVRAVSPGGPAAEAGIRAGDVILAVNGTELKEAEPARQIVRILHDVEPDTKVTVRVLRDGKTRDFTVTTRPGPGPMATVRRLPDVELGPFPDFEGAWMFHGPLMDMELATLTPHLGSYFGSDKGVLVLRAPTDGTLKLEDGDVILAIDGRQPTSGSHATRILASYQPGEKLTLRILRQHKTLDLEATVPEHGGHDKFFRRGGAIHEHIQPPPGPVLILGREDV
jgi:predicted metalloprotease with PDZ domain